MGHRPHPLGPRITAKQLERRNARRHGYIVIHPGSGNRPTVFNHRSMSRSEWARTKREISATRRLEARIARRRRRQSGLSVDIPLLRKAQVNFRLFDARCEVA
jgi:hypothetical protein